MVYLSVFNTAKTINRIINTRLFIQLAGEVALKAFTLAGAGLGIYKSYQAGNSKLAGFFKTILYGFSGYISGSSFRFIKSEFIYI